MAPVKVNRGRQRGRVGLSAESRWLPGPQKAGVINPGSFVWCLRAGMRQLVGRLRSEFLAGHRSHSLCALLVPAEDEAGHDDPKGEKSYKSGSGGDGNHFSVSNLG